MVEKQERRMHRPHIIRFKYSEYRKKFDESRRIEPVQLDPYWRSQLDSMFGGW